MNKNIKPRNDKNQRHGYWEIYYTNNQLAFRCVFINGKRNGFEDYYWSNSKLSTKTYYL